MMSATRTLTVTVPAEIADALDQSVQRGEFASESEAFSDAVQSWEKHRNEVDAYMKQYMIEHK